MSSNFFKGHIPSTFGDMQQLLFLDLSSNYLTGEVPESLAKGYSMEQLRLSNNRLHGYIFPRFFGASSVKCLSLNGNHFTGNIPVTLPNRQSLELLDIGNNNITGALPNWIGDMKSLQVLVLSKNHLIGPIPKSFCRLKSLVVLDLSKNNVTGHIPSCFSPPSLKYVNLRGNELIGTLDNAAFINSSQLTILDVGDNHIRSSIPCWIANHHQELRILVLKGNHFEGHIPIQLCRLQQLIMIDLSSNNLSGPIPSCLNNVTGNPSELFNPSIEILTDVVLDSNRKFNIVYRWQHSTEEHVEFTSKKRVNVYEGKNIRFASGIDLSSNKLSGNIPPEIGNLSLIHTLNLSHNCLAGSIPETFSRLQSMESLDLSYNHLTGPIPAQLVDLNFLSNFSVAHNDLSGETPKRIGQFATFEESSYDDNPLLCGPPLKKNCSATNATPSTIASGTDDSSIDHAAFYASFAGAFVVGFFGVIVFLFINPYWRKIWFQMVDRSISATEYFLIDRFYKLKHLVCG
ncbi:hypothetical protein Sjap_009214 [Stephania japonica]|uniref:Uncharacterized protein n=1 Tax=Stephania japonica TaxID=461633 RepID=A0AAP0JRX2_9MAGN